MVVNTIAAVVTAGGDDESLYNYLMSRIKQRHAKNYPDNLTTLLVRLHTSLNPDPETRLAKALEWCRKSIGPEWKSATSGIDNSRSVGGD